MDKKQITSFLVDRIQSRQKEIYEWLESLERAREMVLYSSVDIRDSGFKMVVIDTNLFPAGFNNLCPHGIEDSVKVIRKAVLDRVPSCRRILLVAEEHTRNTWYLENIRILHEIINNAGFESKIATFLTIQPAFCENTKYVELETATGNPVRIHCFQKILNNIKAGIEQFDLIILNNDLTTGIPDVLRESKIPIYPSIHAGWHSRLKSHHFCHTQSLMNELSRIVDLDPWFFSCFYSVADGIDINRDEDRNRMAKEAEQLFARIGQKYKEHGITEKPYVVVKSDSGTYGMGVLVIEHPDELVNLNRKEKNKLYKGKSSQVIERYLLQEGVPTIHNIDHKVSEVCIYQIDNRLVGGFYRSHAEKGARENLNSKGMNFEKMCPHLSKFGDCGVHHDLNVFDIYRILARVAGIAAYREVVQLEHQPAERTIPCGNFIKDCGCS